MKKVYTCLILLWCIILTLPEAFTQKIINCYWGTWAYYRPGAGRFQPRDVDTNLCTHISYAFFGISASGELLVLDDYLALPSGLNFIQQAIALKEINPKLKVIAAIGGWNEGSVKYSKMARDVNKRSTFIESTVAFLKRYGFDGISFDWEYPAQRGGVPKDKKNFVTLLKEIKEAFRQFGWELFIAAAAAQPSAMLSYDVPEISKYVDFIDIMTYDMAGTWDGVTGIHSPLRGRRPNNIVASVDYWLSAGVPPNKLVLGLAFYGRTFKLADSQQTLPGSPITGPAKAGPYTQEPGFWAYYEICQKINQSSWKVKWDRTAQAPYAYKDKKWVGYDNVESINLKCDYINSMGLAGACIWSIEVDDFGNKCGAGRYPLLTAVKNKILDNNSSIDTTSTSLRPTTSTSMTPSSTSSQASTASPATTLSTSSLSTTKQTSSPMTSTSIQASTETPVATSTTSTPTSTKSPNNGTCVTDGFYKHEFDCSKFYRCVEGKRYDFQCSEGLLYDELLNACNWAPLVKCDS